MKDEHKQDRLGLSGQCVAEKYLVERVIGDGGFSLVYRATHKIWREPVALKCFVALRDAPVEMREALLESFVREGKLMSQLSSQSASVAQARDMGSLTLSDGSWIPYLVLEWLDGATLAAVLDSELALRTPARDLKQALIALQGPAEALSLAHAMGVAHMDVKPDNFFVCGDSLREGVTVKVLDFGVSKVFDRRHVRAGEYGGKTVSMMTPDYAPPELYDAGFGAPGPQTDVFGFALILLEVLRGGRPVLSEGVDFDPPGLAVMRKRCVDLKARPTPRSLGLNVSDEIEKVFAKALAVRVEDRYGSMADFYSDLRQAVGLSEYIVRPLSRVLSEQADRGALEASENGLRPVSRTRPKSPRLLSSTGSFPTISASEDDDEPMPKRRGRVGTLLLGATLAAVGLWWWLPNTESGDAVKSSAAVAAAPEKAPEPPPPPRPDDVCPDGMLLVPGGKFFMGSDADEPVLAAARPAHQVELQPYCLDVFEAKLGDYRKCSEVGDCKRAFRDSRWPQGSSSGSEWRSARKAYSELCNENYDDRDEHPVNCVTWDQADAFCKKRGHRLPREAEWEFAARGSDGRVFPWGDEDPDAKRANVCGLECTAWRERVGLDAKVALYDVDDGFPGTSPGGQFVLGRGQWGHHDLVGNLFEWTADEFLPYENAPEGAAGFSSAGRDNQKHVIRGGAFNSFNANFADPALRYGMADSSHSHGIGFRCASAPLVELSYAQAEAWWEAKTKYDAYAAEHPEVENAANAEDKPSSPPAGEAETTSEPEPALEADTKN